MISRRKFLTAVAVAPVVGVGMTAAPVAGEAAPHKGLWFHAGYAQFPGYPNEGDTFSYVIDVEPSGKGRVKLTSNLAEGDLPPWLVDRFSAGDRAAVNALLAATMYEATTGPFDTLAENMAKLKTRAIQDHAVVEYRFLTSAYARAVASCLRVTPRGVELFRQIEKAPHLYPAQVRCILGCALYSNPI